MYFFFFFFLVTDTCLFSHVFAGSEGHKVFVILCLQSPAIIMLAKAHLEHSCFCNFHFLFLWSSNIAQACSNELAISNINTTRPTWSVLPTCTFCLSLSSWTIYRETSAAMGWMSERFLPLRMSSFGGQKYHVATLMSMQCLWEHAALGWSFSPVA